MEEIRNTLYNLNASIEDLESVVFENRREKYQLLKVATDVVKSRISSTMDMLDLEDLTEEETNDLNHEVELLTKINEDLNKAFTEYASPSIIIEEDGTMTITDLENKQEVVEMPEVKDEEVLENIEAPEIMEESPIDNSIEEIQEAVMEDPSAPEIMEIAEETPVAVEAPTIVEEAPVEAPMMEVPVEQPMMEEVPQESQELEMPVPEINVFDTTPEIMEAPVEQPEMMEAPVAEPEVQPEVMEAPVAVEETPELNVEGLEAFLGESGPTLTL